MKKVFIIFMLMLTLFTVTGCNGNIIENWELSNVEINVSYSSETTFLTFNLIVKNKLNNSRELESSSFQFKCGTEVANTLINNQERIRFSARDSKYLTLVFTIQGIAHHDSPDLFFYGTQVIYIHPLAWGASY